MDIQSLLAAIGNGSGAAPRPIMLDPGAAMGALPSGISPPTQPALKPGAMPQMPQVMQRGPFAQNQSAEMAARALSAPQQPAPQMPSSNMGSLLALHQMQGGSGGGLGDLLGLNRQAPVTPDAPPPVVNSQAPLGTGVGLDFQPSFDPNAPDLGMQAAGIHGLWHRLAGLFG